MAKGALETVKIGGMRRVTEEGLARYLKGTPQEDKVRKDKL
jgi:hypothetical protein